MDKGKSFMDELNKSVAEYKDAILHLNQQLAKTKGNILRHNISFILDRSNLYGDYSLLIEDYDSEHVVNLKIGNYKETKIIFKRIKSKTVVKIMDSEFIPVYSLMTKSNTDQCLCKHFPSHESFEHFLSVFCKYVYGIDINVKPKIILDKEYLDQIDSGDLREYMLGRDQEWFMSLMKDEFWWLEKVYDIDHKKVFIFGDNWAHFGVNRDSNLEMVLDFRINLTDNEDKIISYYIKIISKIDNDYYTEFKIEPFGSNINGDVNFKKLDLSYFPSGWSYEKAEEFLTDVAGNIVNGSASPYWYFEKMGFRVDGPWTIFGTKLNPGSETISS